MGDLIVKFSLIIQQGNDRARIYVFSYFSFCFFWGCWDAARWYRSGLMAKYDIYKYVWKNISPFFSGIMLNKKEKETQKKRIKYISFFFLSGRRRRNIDTFPLARFQVKYNNFFFFFYYWRWAKVGRSYKKRKKIRIETKT